MQATHVARLVALVWVAAVAGAGALFDVTTWRGALLLVLVGIVTPLAALHAWRAPDESMSQRIQRELR
jgi:hypothetical protein